MTTPSSDSRRTRSIAWKEMKVFPAEVGLNDTIRQRESFEAQIKTYATMSIDSSRSILSNTSFCHASGSTAKYRQTESRRESGETYS